jgi:hypothetical protein
VAGVGAKIFELEDGSAAISQRDHCGAEDACRVVSADFEPDFAVNAAIRAVAAAECTRKRGVGSALVALGKNAFLLLWAEAADFSQAGRLWGLRACGSLDRCKGSQGGR